MKTAVEVDAEYWKRGWKMPFETSMCAPYLCSHTFFPNITILLVLGQGDRDLEVG